MIDMRDLSDDDLDEMGESIAFERQVRAKVALLASGLCREFVVWGPGPPYYAIPHCKLPDGHEGAHEPHMTHEECHEAWLASSTAFFDRHATDGVLIEAEVAKRMA